jgi:hypothetical protein
MIELRKHKPIEVELGLSILMDGWFMFRVAADPYSFDTDPDPAF